MQEQAWAGVTPVPEKQRTSSSAGDERIILLMARLAKWWRCEAGELSGSARGPVVGLGPAPPSSLVPKYTDRSAGWHRIRAASAAPEPQKRRGTTRRLEDYNTERPHDSLGG